MTDVAHQKEGQPLAGRRIVITRPRDQSASLRSKLESMGAEVVVFPTIKIAPAEDLAPLHAALDRIAQYDWILFTSQNAADALARELDGDPATALGGVRVAAVGNTTRQRLEDLGLEVHFVPTKFKMSALCAELVEKTTVSGQRFLYPCGDLADADGPRPLSEAGAVVDTVVCYRTLPDLSGDVHALQRCLVDGEIDAVVFASPSAAQGFFARVEAQRIPPEVTLVSIGPKTTAALRSITDCAILEAQQASAMGIVQALRGNSAS